MVGIINIDNNLRTDGSCSASCNSNQEIAMQRDRSQAGEQQPLNEPGARADAGFGAEGAAMLRDIWAALGQPAELLDHVHAVGMGQGDLPSVYAVTDLAAASVGAAALSMASLLARRQSRMPAVQIDRALASRWFAYSIQPQGWSLPPAWDPISGDYETRDGWIKLHTNAPHHRAAALRALGLDPHDAAMRRETVGEVVRSACAGDLETEVVNQGGCAAQMHSAQAWAGHPQGSAVHAEPLLMMREFDAGLPRPDWPLGTEKPLQGIRVLDLTRILAGPVATRFLAGYGAEVLRIDPLDWDEPALAPEVTLGKRRARLDLRSGDGVATFERLLAQADVLVHGYRSDALEKLGLGVQRRRELNPGLVDVCLDAYGWTGDWRARRGFDSLVQMSSGIAEAGMRIQGKSVPTPLPVQALDHAAGYLLAAAVLRGLERRLDHGAGSSTRASLARTAAMFTQHSLPRQRETAALPEAQASDYAGHIERTPWGPARRMLPPCAITGTRMQWAIPAGNLGDSAPAWDR
jgi:hypothetical protein